MESDRKPATTRVTLQQIANRAKVSKATVSLALRGQASIPAATRARIEALAEKMGYRPDPALAVIASHRWKSTGPASGAMIAWVRSALREPARPAYLDQRLSGARARATELGHTLEDIDPATIGHGQLHRVLKARGVRGILLEQTRYTRELPDIDWNAYSVVSIGLSHIRNPFHLVRDDSFQSFRLAWETVHSRGYQRVGFVCLPVDGSENELRLIAAHDALLEKIPERQKVARLHWKPGDLVTLRTWLDQEKPDALLGFDPRVENALRSLGYQLNGDMGYAGLDLGTRLSPSAGIDHLSEHVGEVAVDYLDLMLRRGERGIPTRRHAVLIGNRWIDGPTLPLCPRSTGAKAARVSA